MAGNDYTWGSVVDGSWDVASNWDDTTTGQDPASVAPGVDDNVTIDAASAGATHVVTGAGDAATLSVSGPTLLTGRYTITGALSLGAGVVLRGEFDAGSLNLSGVTLSLNASDSLTLGGDASINGGLSADGGVLGIGGSISLGVNSTLSIGGGTAATIGQSVSGDDATVNVVDGSLSIADDYTTIQNNAINLNSGSLTIDGNLSETLYYPEVLNINIENNSTFHIVKNLSDEPHITYIGSDHPTDTLKMFLFSPAAWRRLMALSI